MVKKYLVTHNDMDAAGAAIIENTFNCSDYAEKNETYYCNYQDIDETVNNILDDIENKELEDTAYYIKIVDISVNEETANRITEMLNLYPSINVVLLDHHKTTDHLVNLDWCIIDQSRSGCKLYYETYYKNKENGYGKEFTEEFEKFIDYIDKYDTWTWKHENDSIKNEIIKLKTWYNICGLDFFVWYYTNQLVENGDFKIFTDESIKLIANQRKKESDKIKYKMNQFKLVNGIAYVVSDDIEITSLLADAMLDKYPEIKIVAVIYGTGVALRSRESESYDVSLIAKKNGGGGHEHAAGFKYNILEILSEKIRLEI